MTASQSTDERVLKFCKAVCNAWYQEDCVMNDPEREPCTKKTCMVYPIAVETPAKLDVRCGLPKQLAEGRRRG